MKNLSTIILLFMTICLTQTSCLAEIVHIEFSNDEFSYISDKNSMTSVTCTKPFTYDFSPENLCLPIVPATVALNGGATYESSVVKYHVSLVKENIDIAKVILPVTNQEDNRGEHNNMTTQMVSDTIPVCRYVGTSTRQNISLVRFAICPFIYNQTQRKLFLVDEIEIDVRTTPCQSIDNLPKYNMGLESLIETVVNPERLKSIIANQIPSSSPSSSTLPSLESTNSNDRVDYLVITNDALKKSFDELIEWKETKGLRCKITTIGEIDRAYYASDIQLKIKMYLKNLHQNNGLKYVLLGGDDSIVPVRYCYAYAYGYKETTNMPSDLYYACLGEPFDWDGNKDGIYAKFDDHVDLMQDLIVSRLPVRTKEQVSDFVYKLLDYEHNPVYNDNILLAGVKRDYDMNGKSDSEIEGEMLYDRYIAKYWNGRKYNFFDTGTDFEGGKDYDVNATNLTEQISRGYNFIDLSAHGTEFQWIIERSSHYTREHGAIQQNSGHTIVTTVACNTNAFDSKFDPCLSESLIRNRQSGVIAYFGCSREGFNNSEYSQSSVGMSAEYTEKFYENLFSESSRDKHFGDIARKGKEDMINTCYYDNYFKWIQLGLNPIGDPEMPIFISTPKIFNSKLEKVENGFELDCLTNGVKIAVKDNTTNTTFLFENISSINLSDLPETSRICLTKQNYIPKVIQIKKIQNRDFEGGDTIDGDLVLTGAAVHNGSPRGEVVFSKGETRIQAGEVLLDTGTVIEKGAVVEINTKK